MKTGLVIEVELNVRESLVDLLEIEGFKSIAADNGKTGLTIALTEHLDLVLCDISMPFQPTRICQRGFGDEGVAR
jgi:DNA-binding response OmpR family regulator